MSLEICINDVLEKDFAKWVNIFGRIEKKEEEVYVPYFENLTKSVAGGEYFDENNAECYTNYHRLWHYNITNIDTN